MRTAQTPHRVAAGEIAELLTWCRRLSVAGPDDEPAERAAYLGAKADLLARITAPDPHPARHDHKEQR